MKKYYYLLFLLLAGALNFSLSACGDDDDDDNQQDKDNTSTGTSTTQGIIDSGKYGKFEVCTINGTNYYNCIYGLFLVQSTWYEQDSYWGWKGPKVEGSVVGFDYFLYEEPSIESQCKSRLGLTIPKSSLQKGKDITHDILNAYADIGWLGQYQWGGSSPGHLDDAPIVKSGSIKVSNRSGDKVTLQFNNVILLERKHDLISDGEGYYFYDDSERTITINGSVTSEYDN